MNRSQGYYFTSESGKIMGSCSGNYKSRIELSVEKDAFHGGRSGSLVWSDEQNSIVGMIATKLKESKDHDWIAAIPIEHIEGAKGKILADTSENEKCSIGTQEINYSNWYSDIQKKLETFSESPNLGDPFQKLAWLIEEYEEILLKYNKEAPQNRVLGIFHQNMTQDDYKRKIYEYKELEIDQSFPDAIIEALDPNFWNFVLDIDHSIKYGTEAIRGDDDRNRNLYDLKEWLGFERYKRPSSYLPFIINKLSNSHIKLMNDDSLNIDDIKDEVILAFDQSKKLLQQLCSFYGYALYGKNYRNIIFNLSGGESENNNFSYLVQLLNEIDLSRVYIFSWNDIPGKDNSRLANFLNWRLGINWAIKATFEKLDEGNTIRVSFMEKMLSLKLNDKKIEITLENSSDKTYKLAEDMEIIEHNIYLMPNFESLFKRKRLFPDQMASREEILVPIRKGPKITMQRTRVLDKNSSSVIETLRILDRLLEVYVNESDFKDFLHPNNEKIIREGAINILLTFINLWKNFQDDIFPQIVVIRRLIQVDPNLIRLDCMLENGELRCFRIEASALPSYTTKLIGKEVYLCLQDVEDDIISKLLLYPVYEELWETIE